MNITTERAGRVSIVRVGETRMMYPLLSEFQSTVLNLLFPGDDPNNSKIPLVTPTNYLSLFPDGRREILIDLTPVTYVDSATIGCLLDLYRQATVHHEEDGPYGPGGHLKLLAVQKRVETMLRLTGAQNFIEIHADEPTAVKSFGA